MLRKPLNAPAWSRDPTSNGKRLNHSAAQIDFEPTIRHRHREGHRPVDAAAAECLTIIKSGFQALRQAAQIAIDGRHPLAERILLRKTSTKWSSLPASDQFTPRGVGGARCDSKATAASSLGNDRSRLHAGSITSQLVSSEALVINLARTDAGFMHCPPHAPGDNRP